MGKNGLVVLAVLCFVCALSLGLSDKGSDSWKTTGKYAKTPFGVFAQYILRIPDETALRANGGGVDCAGCTMVVGIVEQLTQVHNKSVDEVMQMLCSYLPALAQPPCQDLITQFGPTIIVMIDNGETPDAICAQIELCNNVSCTLYPPPSSPTWKIPIKASIPSPPKLSSNIPKPQQRSHRSPKLKKSNQPPTWSPWDWIIDEIDHVFNTHEPLFDEDNDLFSTYFGLRGTYWRGKDCNDEDADVYPGRKVAYTDPSVDHNCNGISGSAPNGSSWESIYCGVKQYGIAVLGDSASAHFHIPPSFVTATEINELTYENLIDIIEMEGDWPQMSSGTGRANTSSEGWQGHPVGPVESMYSKMVERNLCMHRDYQMIAVNGARSGPMANNIIDSYWRNQTLDFPSLTAIALLGNDVCNGHPGTGSMTTPQEFYVNIVTLLQKLDTLLPFGSHVTMMGLIDGRILYDTMADRIHPIGALRSDVTYATFYNFLNCLQISPCWGWMNSDAYWRNATTARAFELNAVYQDIVKNHTFKNFDMTYTPCPMPEVVKMWNKMGGQTYQLIEPVDGFHPTQISNALFTEYQFELYTQKYPYLLPPVNPFNAAIKQRFGNQGGY